MNNKKQHLVNLGPEKLADILLELAEESDIVKNRVNELTHAACDNTQDFQRTFKILQQMTHFIGWHQAAELADELELLVMDIKARITDPCSGVQLMAEFFETDVGVLGHCDDSNGSVGDIYRFDAADLFVDYASRCDEKEKIVDIVFRFIAENPYGVRDALVERVSEFLPESLIRKIIHELESQAVGEKDETDKRGYYIHIEMLAREIHDAELYEKTRIASWNKLNAAAWFDIAKVYFESGQAEIARDRLESVSADESYMEYERQELLLEIYKKLGDAEKLSELLFNRFQQYPCVAYLQDLLEIIGNDKRQKVIDKELESILTRKQLRLSDAVFLLDIGKPAQAETFILDRAEQLDGDFYPQLVSLAETFVSKKRNLAASLIYRSLLLSILERGYSKAYAYAVRYLKKLDKLAVYVSDWKRFDNQDIFKEQIFKAHSRKYSFWNKYNDKA